MIVLTTRKPEINSRVITPGTYAGISLPLFKQHLKWDATDTSEDDLMNVYLTSAIKQAESYTRRVIDRATWRTYLEGFFDVTFDVAPIDLTTGFSVKYFDSTNTEQTLSSSDYTLINNGADSYAAIEFENDLPELYDRNEPVFIEYFAGEATYPADIVPIIMQYAADLFETRTNDVSGSLDRVTFGFHQRLFPYKML
jgi:hypothetical protein